MSVGSPLLPLVRGLPTGVGTGRCHRSVDGLGQVRDVLTVAEPDDEPPMCVTIEEAIAAGSKSHDKTGPMGRSDPRRTRLAGAAG